MLAWLFCLLMAPQVSGNRSSIPRFDQFSVKASFSKKPAAPVLSGWHRRFRTRIREGAAQGPNFGGHYTIANWGCGSSCVSGVVIDAKTGTVHDLPFDILGFGLLRFDDGKRSADDEFEPLSFVPSSRLLVVHGCPEDSNCGAYYYEFTGTKFRLITKFGASRISN
jgi:hypothetical protein